MIKRGTIWLFEKVFWFWWPEWRRIRWIGKFLLERNFAAPGQAFEIFRDGVYYVVSTPIGLRGIHIERPYPWERSRVGVVEEEY